MLVALLITFMTISVQAAPTKLAFGPGVEEVLDQTINNAGVHQVQSVTTQAGDIVLGGDDAPQLAIKSAPAKTPDTKTLAKKSEPVTTPHSKALAKKSKSVETTNAEALVKKSLPIQIESPIQLVNQNNISFYMKLFSTIGY